MLPLLAAIAPFAPIIGGAIGALGQLFAPKPEPVKNSIDLKGLRNDAEAAGFNPLTIIRGGGLAGYGVSSAAPDMRVSNALQTFGSGVAQWQYDPYGQQKSLAELKLAEAQIAKFAREGSAPRNMSFGAPKSSGPSTTTMFGATIPHSPAFSDAQDVENRYGDFLGSVIGFPIAIQDFTDAAGGWVDQQIGRLAPAWPAMSAAGAEWVGNAWGNVFDPGKPPKVVVRGAHVARP